MNMIIEEAFKNIKIAKRFRVVKWSNVPNYVAQCYKISIQIRHRVQICEQYSKTVLYIQTNSLIFLILVDACDSWFKKNE